MGSDRIRAEGKKSSSLIPAGSKPKQFSFLQSRFQEPVLTDSVRENQQQANPKPALSHSFGRIAVESKDVRRKFTVPELPSPYERVRRFDSNSKDKGRREEEGKGKVAKEAVIKGGINGGGIGGGETDKGGIDESAQQQQPSPDQALQVEILSNPPQSEHNLKQVGVSDEVAFQALTTEKKEVEWSADKGSDFEKFPDQENIVKWRAPSEEGIVTITCTNQDEKLELQVEVLKPEKAEVTEMNPVNIKDHNANDHAGAGMKQKWEILPNHVNFGNIQVIEGEAQGIRSGYFDNRSFLENLSHPKWDKPALVTFHGNANRMSGEDHAGIYQLPQPWSDGSLRWDIPFSYVTQDGKEIEFSKHTQQFQITSDGNVTVLKLGCQVTMKALSKSEETDTDSSDDYYNPTETLITKSTHPMGTHHL